MSSHADTIRYALGLLPAFEETAFEETACLRGLDALEALLAENQRLRDALEAMRALASVSTDGDGWYAEQAGLDADAIFTQAREALAGDAE